MDTGFGLWSVLPPVVAIVLAIWTRQVYVSLLLGIFLGWLIINDGHLIDAFMDTLGGFVEVFADAGNTRTIMFSALIGALIVFIQRSGGVEGFIRLITARLEKMSKKGRLKNQKVYVQLLAFLTGTMIFVESSISVLTVGSLFRPVCDRLGISREKLAYIADSSSAPICILLPFNGWGALVMGLLLAQGFENPFQLMFQSAIYNFYPILALILLLFVIFFQWDLPAMRRAEERSAGGKLFWDGAQPMVSEEITETPPKPGISPKARNMVFPLLIMVAMMPVVLAATGWNSEAALESDTWSSRLIAALGQGSGSTSVLVAVVVSILLSSISYAWQGIFNLKETVDLIFKGISGLMPIALLLMFAFAIGAVCKQLETGQYVAALAADWLQPLWIPMILFLISSFIAFATGTSWGTFAIMIPIAIPMAAQMSIPYPLAIAAALGGGIFGDHCSPISDTTILSSMAAATDHIDHVRTQIPYALLAGSVACLCYLLAGMLMT